MAQIYTDWSDVNLSTEFSSTAGTGAAQYAVSATSNPASPSGLRVTPVVTSAAWLSWDAAGSTTDDCEVRALASILSTTTTNGAGPAFAVGGTSTQRRGAGTNLRARNSKVVGAGAWLMSGGINVNSTEGTVVLSANTPYWLSIERKAGVVTSRVHSYPDRVLLDEVVWSPGASSELGLGLISQSTAVEFYSLSVGTNGDPAPYGPEPSSGRRRCPLLLTPW